MPNDVSSFSGECVARKDVLRALILVEAAIEGADMGDRELQDAISCELLDVIKALSCQDTMAQGTASG